MQTDSIPTSVATSKSELRTLVLASLGGALEFYDFVIFVFFTAVIGKLFFSPALPEWVRQFQTFGIFAVGYLARPLGGVVMAHFGDKLGRKRMFTLSVLLMAVPTFLIGLLPTYDSIGMAAPILLLVLRILQGVAIGGEAPGAWVFVSEHARQGRIGLAVGALTGGLSSGIFLGSLMAACMHFFFSPVKMAAGGWRIPFLIGGVFGLIAMWLRQWLDETPVFQEIRRRAQLSRSLPLREVLVSHGRAVFASAVCTWMLTASIVVTILMSPVLEQKLFGISALRAQSANLAATAALCLSAVLVGAAVDRFGLRSVAIPSLLLMAGSTCALFGLVDKVPSALLPLSILMGLGAGGVSLTPIFMVRAFPAAVRYSGVSFSYNIAYAVFGGITPLLVSWIVHFDRVGPAYYVTAAAAFALLVILTTSVNFPDAPQSSEPAKETSLNRS